jgi:hypothetical protein
MTRRVLVLLAGLVVACGAPDATGDALASRRASPSDDSSSGEDEELDTSESATTTTTSSPSPASKGACSSKTSAQSCLDCCSAKAPGAIDVYAIAFASCLCEAPGACAEACAATLCSGAKPDAACSSCMQTARCEDPALTACEKDATCAPFLSCVTASDCATK